ncbi:hypothetical protein HPB47_018204, partial [Ixodes persulcatus]
MSLTGFEITAVYRNFASPNPGVPKLQPFIFPNQEQMPKKVVVHCVVLEGDEPFKFSWLKDGIALASNRKVQVKVSEAVSSLTITTVDAEDIGNYTCVVRNAAGSDSFTSQLLVTVPPKLQPLFLPREHPLMEALVVSCIAIRGTPPLEFSWYKDGELATRRALPQMLSDTVSTLTIAKVGAEDPGNYTCRASNAVGSDSYTAALTVAAEDIGNYTCVVSNKAGKDSFTSSLVINGDEPLTFSWYKDGRKLATNRNIHVKLLSETVTSLTLVEADASDIGNYTCEVSNVAGVDSVSSQFLITVPPLLQKFQFKDGIGVGDQTTVVCAVIEGDLPLEFRWAKDDKVLVNSKATSLKTLNDNIASLTLHKISASDLGNYTCFVENAAGTASVTAALVVRGIHNYVHLVDFNTSSRHFLSMDAYQHHQNSDGVPMVNSARVITSSVADNIALLVINKLAALDVGNYSCVARNAQGEDRVTAALTVEAAPVWLSEPKDTDAVQGRDLILACNAAGFPKPRFTWKMQI